MEENKNQNENQKKERTQAEWNRLAGYAFIGAGTAWLVAGLYLALSVSLIALGIVFLATSKKQKQ